MKFSGVQVFVYDEDGLVYIGERTTGGWKYDVGAAGLRASGKSFEECASHELYEEFGVHVSEFPLQVITTLYPCDGLSCVVRVYKVVVPRGTSLASTDVTYSRIFHIPVSDVEGFLRSEWSPELPGTKWYSFPILHYL